MTWQGIVLLLTGCYTLWLTLAAMRTVRRLKGSTASPLNFTSSPSAPPNAFSAFTVETDIVHIADRRKQREEVTARLSRSEERLSHAYRLLGEITPVLDRILAASVASPVDDMKPTCFEVRDTGLKDRLNLVPSFASNRVVQECPSASTCTSVNCLLCDGSRGWRGEGEDRERCSGEG